MEERKRCPVSYLAAPVRTPPERVLLPIWENPPTGLIVEPLAPYLILVTPMNVQALANQAALQESPMRPPCLPADAPS